MLKLKLKYNDDYSKFDNCFRESKSIKKMEINTGIKKDVGLQKNVESGHNGDYEQKILELQKEVESYKTKIEDELNPQIGELQRKISIYKKEMLNDQAAETEDSDVRDNIGNFLRNLNFETSDDIEEFGLKRFIEYIKNNNLSFEKFEKIFDVVIRLHLDEISNLNLFNKLNKGNVAKQNDQMILSMNEINKTFFEIENVNFPNREFNENIELYKAFDLFLENFMKINARLMEATD